MKDRGFTLTELLIAITIIGIILSFSIAIINKLTVKNKLQQYSIYSDVLLDAAKVYNDEYEEDTFAKREYGCSKVSFSTLQKKNLIRDLSVKGVKCGYVLNGRDDSSGVIIRKVKNIYYYETILYCKKQEHPNKNTDYVEGEDNTKYFYEIGDTECNTTASTDTSSPNVYYRNTNLRVGHFYNKDNLPKPQVKISDSGVGLNNISDLNYKWNSKNKLELLRFTTKKGSGTTRWKDVPLPNDLTKANSNYTEHLKVTIKNVEDLAKNVHISKEIDTLSNDKDVNNQTGTYYVDNTSPIINVTARKAWTKRPFSITMNVYDTKVNGVRSGIKKVTYKLTNRYSPSGNAQTITIDKTSYGRGNAAGSANNNRDRGEAGDNQFKKTIRIDKPGDYTLKVDVEDWAGNKVSKTYANYYQYDNIPPTCGTASTSSATPWINRNRTVSIRCNDQRYLSQCTQTRYSRTFGESNTGTITISDVAGNSTVCTVITKVDKTKPTCTSSGGRTSWRKAALTIKGTCNDNRSGCRQRTYTKIYSGNANTTTAYGGRAYDNAGNWVDCTKNQHVHIDNTAPSCSIRYESGANRAGQGLTVTVRCTDNYSIQECDRWAAGASRYNGYEKTLVQEPIGDLKVSATKHVKDSAGNTSHCSISIVPSSCTKTEIISNHSDRCSDGLCQCQSYYCPSGQWAVNKNVYDQDFHTQVCVVKYSWSCKGNVRYTDNGNKCGYHVR